MGQSETEEYKESKWERDGSIQIEGTYFYIGNK